MKKVDARASQRARRLCRDIGQQANNRQHLQNLVIQLQELLVQERIVDENYSRPPIRRAGDNPFDKIMVG